MEKRLLSYGPDPHIAQFLTADCCRAAGISPGTIKAGMNRFPPAVIISDSDRQGTSGRAHLFTASTIFQVPLTAELASRGVDPRIAARAAAILTETNSGLGGDGRRRLPGQLFPTGATLLVSDKPPNFGRVVNCCNTLSLSELFAGATGATALWVNQYTKACRQRSFLMRRRPPGQRPPIPQANDEGPLGP